MYRIKQSSRVNGKTVWLRINVRVYKKIKGSYLPGQLEPASLRVIGHLHNHNDLCDTLLL